MTTTSFEGLASLRGLRTAPDLDPGQRQQLRQELTPLLAACEWCTIGVMAPSAAQALAALRQLEAAMGWPALAEARDGGEASPEDGEGLLITGHHDRDPSCEDTWGPLPLELFA
jgi:hypothetical protein